MLDDAVAALGAGVGQPGLQGGDDRRLPGLDGAGESDHLGHLGRAEPVEAVQGGVDLITHLTAVSA